MAHQTHKLPWNGLASIFKFTPRNNRDEGRTNLYYQDVQGSRGRLNHFAKVFIAQIEAFSTETRAKYPEHYESPRLDEAVITRDIERKISASLHRSRCNARPRSYSTNHACVKYTYEDSTAIRLTKCEFALTHEETQASYIVSSARECRCSSLREEHQDPINMIKLLLMYDEMDALFRLCATQGVDFTDRWWSFPYDSYEEYGWAEVMRAALMAYVCLNVWYVKHNSGYDNISAKTTAHGISPEPLDYRLTTSYQRMFLRCVGSAWSDTYTYPHRQFYGVQDGEYSGAGGKELHWSQNKLLGVGLMSLQRRVRNRHNHDAKLAYAPTSEDIPAVRHILCQVGDLPPELADEILARAEYKPHRKMPVPHDPLHAQNSEELLRYLNYCWKLLVRCDMLVRECGKVVDWHGELATCIRELWGQPNSKGWILWEHEVDEFDRVKGYTGNEVEERLFMFAEDERFVQYGPRREPHYYQ